MDRFEISLEDDDFILVQLLVNNVVVEKMKDRFYQRINNGNK